MNPQKNPFTGVCTALITPFQPDGSPDLDALARLIEGQIAAGVDALLLLGTTGESATVTDGERLRLIRRAVDAVAGRVPLVVGTGSNATARAVELSRSAEENGCDAVLVVTPYYNRATPAGLIRHLTVVADAVRCPVILYNVPSRTGVDLTPAVCRELAAHPRIFGIKEASGKIDRIADLCADGSLAVYAGCDGEAIPAFSLGASGVISVLSNLFPAEVAAMWRAWRAGERAEALRIQTDYLPLVRALFSEVNPIPVKTAAGMLGLCADTLRLPLCPMAAENREKLAAALERVRERR